MPADNPDRHYIPAFTLEEIFLDKDSGLPLAGGIVTFYQDQNRVPAGLKDVYQITGTSGAYTFTQLPNPMTLSSIGTFEDAMGNPIVPYFYPFDDNGDVELYYVTVDSAGLIRQFTREAVPYVPDDLSPTSGESLSNENQLSNPQFVDVLFEEAYFSTPTSRDYAVSGSSLVTAVAPGWDIVTSGTGTITVERIAISSVVGGTSVESQPPFALRIASASVSLTSVVLRQRLEQSPRLDVGFYVSGYFVASSRSGAQTVTMTYTPSSGSSVVVVTGSVPSGGAYTSFKDANNFTQTINPDSGITGYVDINITLPVATDIVITSLQIVQNSNGDLFEFNQMSAARQRDQLSHYYMPQVQQKPIPSYLIGWDFPLNPYQAFGPARASFNTGAANRSFVAWDQTIIFQSANSGIAYSQSATGALRLTANSTTQTALIQYLEAATIRELLVGRMAVNVAAYSNVAAGIGASIQLYYTTDANLPIAKASTHLSIVATLNANGTVATFNGNWTLIPRINNLGTAQFKIQQQNGSDQRFYDYDFNGWSLEGSVVSTTATYFAIVIGTESMASTNLIDFLSVGLMSGDVATRPAAKTKAQVLADCQYYYYKTFPLNVYPDGGPSARQVTSNQISAIMHNNSGSLHTKSFTIFNPVMRSNFTFGTDMFFYSPSTGTEDTVLWVINVNGSNVDSGDFVATTEWVIGSSSNAQAFFVAQNTGTAVGSGGGANGDCLIRFHYLVDRRLGVFN